MNKLIELGIAAIAGIQADVYCEGDLEMGMELALYETEPEHYSNPKSDMALTMSKKMKERLHRQAAVVGQSIIDYFRRGQIAIVVGAGRTLQNGYDWSKVDLGQWEDRSGLLNKHSNKSIEKAFVGKTASVQISSFHHIFFGRVFHLWVRRHDQKPIGWAELQRTKNAIMGAEVLAIQVYPKESKLVDQANMYHLWAFPEFEFGVDENGFIF